MQEFFNILMKYLPIIISLLALVFSLYNNRKNHKKSVYFEIDKQYNELLKLALQNPELRDFSKTSDYINADKQSAFYIRYNLYAYMVWNTLETIYDQNNHRGKKNKIKFDTWLPVIKEENKIHYSWFKHNIHLFKPSFSDFIINKFNNLQIKRVSSSELVSIYPYFESQFPPEERKSLGHFKHLLQNENYSLHVAYHSALPEHENIIGYAFIFTDIHNKSVWVDYLGVLPGFQSSGYGTTIFNKIVDSMGLGECNVFLEVEIPKNNDPENPENKRMRFYKKLNCLAMPYEYYLPTPGGKEKMCLFCRPSNKIGVIYKLNLQAVIEKALNVIHSDIPHTQQVIQQNIKNITTDFSYSE